MQVWRDRKTLEVWGGIDPAPLAEPLILSAGARSGVDVVRLQELVAAAEIAVRSAQGAPVTIAVDSSAGRVSVSVRPVTRDRLEPRLAFVRHLVGSVEIGDGGATLHAGA